MFFSNEEFNNSNLSLKQIFIFCWIKKVDRTGKYKLIYDGC